MKKITYSAFIAGSSDLDALLSRHSIETVLIAGTVTNVCCESSARAEMMLEFRVTIVSNANAALTEQENAATLNSFFVAFGDVMISDDVIQRLTLAANRAVDGCSRV